MKLISYDRFRSEGRGVNKTDDMVRATFDMTANEFKRMLAVPNSELDDMCNMKDEYEEYEWQGIMYRSPTTNECIKCGLNVPSSGESCEPCTKFPLPLETTLKQKRSRNTKPTLHPVKKKGKKNPKVKGGAAIR
jgi:hypothetical protein